MYSVFTITLQIAILKQQRGYDNYTMSDKITTDYNSNEYLPSGAIIIFIGPVLHPLNV